MFKKMLAKRQDAAQSAVTNEEGRASQDTVASQVLTQDMDTFSQETNALSPGTRTRSSQTSIATLGASDIVPKALGPSSIMGSKAVLHDNAVNPVSISSGKEILHKPLVQPNSRTHVENDVNLSKTASPEHLRFLARLRKRFDLETVQWIHLFVRVTRDRDRDFSFRCLLCGCHKSNHLSGKRNFSLLVDHLSKCDRKLVEGPSTARVKAGLEFLGNKHAVLVEKRIEYSEKRRDRPINDEPNLRKICRYRDDILANAVADFALDSTLTGTLESKLMSIKSFLRDVVKLAEDEMLTKADTETLRNDTVNKQLGRIRIAQAKGLLK